MYGFKMACRWCYYQKRMEVIEEQNKMKVVVLPQVVKKPTCGQMIVQNVVAALIYRTIYSVVQ